MRIRFLGWTNHHELPPSAMKSELFQLGSQGAFRVKRCMNHLFIPLGERPGEKNSPTPHLIVRI